MLLALAVILPVGLFAAGAAWFIHTYVVPPTVDIPSQPTLASAEPVNQPATTGVAPAPPVAAEPQASTSSPFPSPSQPAASAWPAPSAPTNSSPWPDVAPTPTAPAFAQNPDPTPASQPPADVELPSTDAVPLPPRRPRISLAVVRGPVPLPRPRPGN